MADTHAEKKNGKTWCGKSTSGLITGDSHVNCYECLVALAESQGQ